jgi:hypothetical protein
MRTVVTRSPHKVGGPLTNPDAGLDEKSMDSQLICEACLGRAELVCTVSAESRY